eukprot:TRINITY_DN103750_c0_g1_i1.p1 TRINITY_DN103750_c0_g1~~TRINITY_DN103750_c0_g1_i1.p1  ORF type:complete len:731 (+),score=77.21 TRINITY_DN103750_c0_g1_i1:260-2194(+)
MYNYEKMGAPAKHGSHYYYYYNSGLQNQSVLYRKATLDGDAEVFVDPNGWSEDGTVALGGASFSESGKYWAYLQNKSGSDWSTFHCFDCETRKDIDTPVEWVKFSGLSWTHDDKGVFLNKYDPQGESMENCGTATGKDAGQKVYYHRLGTNGKDDQLIYKDDNEPDHMYGAEITVDGKYFILTTHESCAQKNKVWYTTVEEVLNNKDPNGCAPSSFNKLVDTLEFEYSYITSTGPNDRIWYFLTNENAPRKKLIAIDLDKPEKENWKEVIPQTENPLSYIDVVGTGEDGKVQFIVVYMVDVKEEIFLYDLDGKQIRTFDVPVGAVGSLSADRKWKEFFFSLTSYLFPGRIYRYDCTTNQLAVYHDTVVKGFDPEQFVSEQVFYPSKDGTKIPMFIVHRKGMQKDGTNGCLLYGYGGFNISLTPSFSVSALVFLQHFNGIYCVANIRGGDEYGEEWHQGGILKNKQNTFDDFQAAAKYLAAEKYTSAEKIAIQGGSNGGLLMGANMNQAPELFGCVICQVGVLDMLRFHKFTIGKHWTSDYGNPDLEEDFKTIFKYSPLHNINTEKEYPCVMLMTADHDDRVVPLHSYKYISELQHSAKPSEKPLLIRIDTKAGHGAGRPVHKIIADAADYYSFIAWSLKLKWSA